MASRRCSPRTGAPSHWMPTSRIHGAARRPSVARADQVIGDVRELPFPDRAFDAAVAIDLLEHLASSDRPQAISEICRVAARRAIVACPAGADALGADRRLAERLRARRRDVPPWLVEHIDNGFPERHELLQLASTFGSVRSLENESLAAHERLIDAETSLLPAAALRLACVPIELLMRSRRPRAPRLAARALRSLRGHDRPPTYRTVLVIDLERSQRRQDPT